MISAMDTEKHSGITDLQTLLMMLIVTQWETGHAILFLSHSNKKIEVKEIECFVHGVSEKKC